MCEGLGEGWKQGIHVVETDNNHLKKKPVKPWVREVGGTGTLESLKTR